MNNLDDIIIQIIEKKGEIKRELECLDEEICTEEKAKGFINGLEFAIEILNNQNKNETTFEEIIWDHISNFDEDYREEVGIDKLDDEDIGSIVCEILNRNDFQNIIYEEIEYLAFKKAAE